MNRPHEQQPYLGHDQVTNESHEVPLETIRRHLKNTELASLEFSLPQHDSPARLSYTLNRQAGTGHCEGIVPIPRDVSVSDILRETDFTTMAGETNVTFSHTDINERYGGILISSESCPVDQSDATETYIKDMLDVWQTLHYQAQMRLYGECADLTPDIHAILTRPPERQTTLDHARMDRIGGMEQTKEALMEASFGFETRYVETFDYRAQPLLLHGPHGVGKSALLEAFGHDYHAATAIVPGLELASADYGQAVSHASIHLDSVAATLPHHERTLVTLDNIDVAFSQLRTEDDRILLARHLQDKIKTISDLPYPTVITATAQSIDAIPDYFFEGSFGFRRCDVPLPTMNERLQIWAALIWSQSVQAIEHHSHDTVDEFIIATHAKGETHQQFAPQTEPEDLSELARQTAGMTGSDIARILNAAKLESIVVDVAFHHHQPISQKSLLRAIDRLKRGSA